MLTRALKDPDSPPLMWLVEEARTEGSEEGEGEETETKEGRMRTQSEDGAGSKEGCLTILGFLARQIR